MKNSFTSILFLFSALIMLANEPELVVRKVSSPGVVQGNTYRVYAHLPDPGQSLHIIWGDTENPLAIESTAPFYQNELGGYSSSSLSAATLEIDPMLAFDSYITIGYENSDDNDLWDLGVDFSDFDNGGAILTNNGAWFLIPSDEKCTPTANGLVLIAQFTTTGIVTGRMNLQGWSAPQVTWQALGLSFTTENAKIFGCMDAGASNYSSHADYDDGTCSYEGIDLADNVMETDHTEMTTSWEIFPNPLHENLIHLQMSKELGLSKEKTLINIYDFSGKLVAGHTIQSENILPGNRVTIQQDLAAGTYKVVLIQGKKQDSKTLVVVR